MEARGKGIHVDALWHCADHRCHQDELQRDVLRLIAERVIAEDKEMGNGKLESEPMNMFLCGGPGVGKSFGIKAIKKLFDSLGWKQGVHYQFAAFQVVVADQIDGDTLHHSFHVKPCNNRHVKMQSVPYVEPMCACQVHCISNNTPKQVKRHL